MNLPNKLTMLRIYMTVLIIAIILMPTRILGIDIPELFIGEKIVVDSRYFIAGILFILASFTDFLDGYIARKYDLVTDYGKLLDAIADKVLVNSILVALATKGMINPLIPIIIISRDTLVNSIKMMAAKKNVVVAAIKMGKIKTATMMVGITLILFYNLPFELINLRIADFLLVLATVFSIISAYQYYGLNKKYISKK